MYAPDGERRDVVVIERRHALAARARDVLDRRPRRLGRRPAADVAAAAAARAGRRRREVEKVVERLCRETSHHTALYYITRHYISL